MEFDYRYSPVNPRTIRYVLFRHVYDFLFSLHGGSMHVGFTTFTLKITSFPEYDQFYILVKKRVLFMKRVFLIHDLLYVFFVLLSFFRVKPKYKKPNYFSFDDHTTTCIKKITGSAFRPSSWVKIVLQWFFKPYRHQPKIILPLCRQSHIYEWLHDTQHGRWKIGTKGSSFLIVRSDQNFTLHFFYSGGGHFIFLLPRTEETFRNLFVLLQIKDTRFRGCRRRFPRKYKTFDLPYYLWFWT